MPAYVTSSNGLLAFSNRVGMIALESLGRRVTEERPNTKFARNPNYADDVKWLMSVARELGNLTGLPYLQTFLNAVVNTIVSPFLLQVSSI